MVTLIIIRLIFQKDAQIYGKDYTIDTFSQEPKWHLVNVTFPLQLFTTGLSFSLTSKVHFYMLTLIKKSTCNNLLDTEW